LENSTNGNSTKGKLDAKAFTVRTFRNAKFSERDLLKALGDSGAFVALQEKSVK